MRERPPARGGYASGTPSFPTAGIIGSRAGRVEDALRAPLRGRAAPSPGPGRPLARDGSGPAVEHLRRGHRHGAVALGRPAGDRGDLAEAERDHARAARGRLRTV